MNLSELFNMQESFNENVSKNEVFQEHEMKYKKILALQIKIAEIASETNCYKYCKVNSNFDSTVLLNKYTDCLHFIISIGLDHGYRADEVIPKSTDLNLTTQFENLYIDINDFVVCSSMDHYITLIEDYICLGTALKFAEKEILSSARLS